MAESLCWRRICSGIMNVAIMNGYILGPKKTWIQVRLVEILQGHARFFFMQAASIFHSRHIGQQSPGKNSNADKLKRSIFPGIVPGMHVLVTSGAFPKHQEPTKWSQKVGAQITPLILGLE